MASPFPGMDPYLEDPAFWRDFHQTFLVCWRQAIAAQLPEEYDARLDETINLVHPSEQDMETIYPDVAVTRRRRADRSRSKNGGGTLVLEPVTITHEYLDEYRQGRIEIRQRPDRRLVTVLELLSPTNKSGDGFAEYRIKRLSILHQKVNLVELDLLLAGKRPVHADPLPIGDYFIYVSRAGRRPTCEVYCWGLRDVLPTMPIPLKVPDKDIHIDLKSVFSAAYELGGYAPVLGYGKKPLAPLRTKDAKWAVALSTKK